jgi:hypothetical protein
MSEIFTFTAQDIKDLGAKLDEMEANFDDREQTLLLALIGLAGESIVARQQEDVVGFSGSPSVSEMVVSTQGSAPPNPFQYACAGVAGAGGSSQFLTFKFSSVSVKTISWGHD